MSIRIMSKVFRLKVGCPTAKLVLLKIADNANDEGYCWPSLRHIQAETELSERAIRNALRKLEALGVLQTQHQKGKKPNIYVINLAKLDELLQTQVSDQVPVSGTRCRSSAFEGHQMPVTPARNAGQGGFWAAPGAGRTVNNRSVNETEARRQELIERLKKLYPDLNFGGVMNRKLC